MGRASPDVSHPIRPSPLVAAKVQCRGAAGARTSQVILKPSWPAGQPVVLAGEQKALVNTLLFLNMRSDAWGPRAAV